MENQQVEDFWIRDLTGDKKLEDEYLLGDVIGRGATSTIYKCLRKGRTEWACKVLKKNQLNKDVVQKQMPKLLTLNHPNIINMKEVFETPSEIQLILELASGGELFERIVEAGCHTEEDAAKAVGHILNALKYLHDNGVIHRDLKPENLLYHSEFEESALKLADFGMNSMLSQEQSQMNRICGSVGLCAPELLENKDIDSSVDLWSVGVVTYIMLCGFEPFNDEKSQTPSTAKIISGDYTFPSPWWDDVSDGAKELISRLLSVNPKERPTAEEALSHPWILGISTSNLHMNDAILRLREFNARRRFRVATKAVLAAQRALSFLPGKTKDNCTGKENEGDGNPAERHDTDRVGNDTDRVLGPPSTDACENGVKLLEQLTINESEKSPVKLGTDLSTPYKESYVDMR